MTELERALLHIKTRADAWAVKEVEKALSQEPCTDTVSIQKNILKCRVGKIVAYNVEWLKKHWQMEMDIVCGVKPCTDAVNRQAVLDEIDDTNRRGGFGGKLSYTRCRGHIEQLPPVTQKPIECDDVISRDAVLEGLKGCICEEWVKTLFATMVKQLPSVTQKAGKCKNCKYFEYDSVAKVDGIPLIVAHEICNKWGNGCKTKEDGYCFLFEPQGRSDKE